MEIKLFIFLLLDAKNAVGQITFFLSNSWHWMTDQTMCVFVCIFIYMLIYFFPNSIFGPLSSISSHVCWQLAGGAAASSSDIITRSCSALRHWLEDTLNPRLPFFLSHPPSPRPSPPAPCPSNCPQGCSTAGALKDVFILIHMWGICGSAWNTSLKRKDNILLQASNQCSNSCQMNHLMSHLRNRSLVLQLHQQKKNQCCVWCGILSSQAPDK